MPPRTASGDAFLQQILDTINASINEIKITITSIDCRLQNVEKSIVKNEVSNADLERRLVVVEKTVEGHEKVIVSMNMISRAFWVAAAAIVVGIVGFVGALLTNQITVTFFH